MIRVKTGEKRMLGLGEKTKLVESGEQLVDQTFSAMLNDYRTAHKRFLELLETA